MKITAALMLKAPRPGTVKTRLAADLGEERATEIYRALVEHQLRQIPKTWNCTIHFAPADGEEEMRCWLAGIAPAGTNFEAQCDGDLGARMRQAVRLELGCGADGVVLLGGDCPELLTNVLLEAATELQAADIVISPATDGGYVLLGLKKEHPELFEDIAWSTSEVLAQTLARASTGGLKVFRTEPFADIDDAASFRSFSAKPRGCHALLAAFAGGDFDDSQGRSKAPVCKSHWPSE